MIGLRRRIGPLFYALALALLAAPAIFAQGVAPEALGVRITAVDTGDFPTVRVRVLTTGPGSAPAGDLSRLLLRENGVPIPEATLSSVPAGIDLALVIDANVDFHVADEVGGATRREKVVAAVGRFAEGSMSAEGLDHVSVIAPDAARLEPLFLIADATTPDALSAAVAAFDFAPPADQPLRATPLQAMLTAALDHLAGQADDGRFQAILLYTDAARIGGQLDAAALTTAAQTAGVPIYVAILGAEAAPDELANSAALTEPTNGRAIHMPAPEAADPLYALFAAQSNQTEMTYVSALRANGTQQVAVNLGNVRDAATFELALAAPEVTLDLPIAIRRVGNAVDTPLALLQPAALSLAAVVSWPDGLPRELTEVTLRVDGEVQPQAAIPQPGPTGRIPLVWDISERDAGDYALTVEVADALGFRVTSAPVTVTIAVARPQPATPTVAPTPAAPAATPTSDARRFWPLALLLPAALLAAWAIRRARRRAPAPPPPPAAPLPPPAARGEFVPLLEWAEGDRREQIELLADNVTLGREPNEVDIVLADPGVARLHARIRRDDGGQYWLYDEGSATGTFLNHEPLGLAPRPLQDGDTVQLGRVSLRFRLEPAALRPAAGIADAAPPPEEKEL